MKKENSIKITNKILPINMTIVIKEVDIEVEEEEEEAEEAIIRMKETEDKQIIMKNLNQKE